MEYFDYQGLAAAVVTIAAVVLTAARIYRDFRRSTDQESQRSEERVRSEVAAEAIDNLSALLVQNFRVLNSYYSANLAQARTSTRASISIAVLGFVAIIAGIVIAFTLKQELLGSVSAAAGIVSQAAATLFFRQNRIFQEQMGDSLRKLVSTQYLMTSIALTRELPDGHRVEEVTRINEHLRELMNLLHSSDLTQEHARDRHLSRPGLGEGSRSMAMAEEVP